MQTANNFIVLNIREYLASEDKRLGEEKLVQLLSEFSCPLNPDIVTVKVYGKRKIKSIHLFN